MATITSNLPPPLLINGRQSLSKTLWKFMVPATGVKAFIHHDPTILAISSPSHQFTEERQGRVTVVTKATGESSESSTSLSIVKSVQNVWDKSEDRLALVGLGFAAVITIWASANLITAIDKLPIIPSTLEFIGILFSSWFTYRYLLFKPDREELFQSLNKSISDVLGQ